MSEKNKTLEIALLRELGYLCGVLNNILAQKQHGLPPDD